jgi:hypothetical protein
MVINPVRFALRQSIIRNIITSPFSPRRLSNLAVWLDAIDGGTLIFNGSTISQWHNKGNMGVGSAVQANAIRQPLYVANAINGKPALRGVHDGINNSRLDIADSAGLDYTAFEVFAVVRRHTDAGGDEAIAYKHSSVAGQREHRLAIGVNDNIVLGVSPDGTVENFATSNASVPAQTIGLNQPRILSANYNPELPSARSKVFVNNVQGDFPSLNPTSAFQGNLPYTLFSRSGDFFNGLRADIGELMFFTRILSSTERTQIITYLSNRWGIV